MFFIYFGQFHFFHFPVSVSICGGYRITVVDFDKVVATLYKHHLS